MRWTLLWALLLALVLLPFVLFGEAFTRFGVWLAQGGARGWALGGIVGTLLALDVVLPVPSSAVSTAAGAVLGFWRGAAVIWIGMTMGCAVGYAIGAGAGGAARRFVGDAPLQRAGRIMDRHGAWALAACRPIPVVAEASVVFSGLVRSPIERFLWITSVSNLGIAVAYAAVGAYAMRLESFVLAFLGATILPAAALLLGRLWLDRGDRQRRAAPRDRVAATRRER